MRTTMNIPDTLITEAMQLTGVKTKTGAVMLSLQELINRKKVEKLRALRGKIDLDIDLDALRRDRVTL